MNRLHQPLTLRNDVSIQNKFNLKRNWFLIYEGKPPYNWTFVQHKYQWSLHCRTTCFMPRAASTCLWAGLWHHAVIFCFQWVCTGEAKGKEMLSSLTLTQKELPSEGSDSWASRGQSQRVVISPQFYAHFPSRGSPAKPVGIPKESRFSGGMVQLKGKRNELEHTNKHC